jgi:hypothetical protein
MNNEDLEKLYEATGEDLLFAIGVMLVPGQQAAPYIHIYFAGWSREQLEVVRESFRDGLILASGRRPTGLRDLYLGTREKIALQASDGQDTSVLRAPAWDAHLSEVAEGAVDRFEANRQRSGGFLLLVQTLEWEFLTAVDDASTATTIGPIEKRSRPMPIGYSYP